MVKKTQWILLFTTFVVSTCSLILVLVAFSVDKWVGCLCDCIFLYFQILKIHQLKMNIVTIEHFLSYHLQLLESKIKIYINENYVTNK